MCLLFAQTSQVFEEEATSEKLERAMDQLAHAQAEIRRLQKVEEEFMHMRLK